LNVLRKTSRELRQGTVFAKSDENSGYAVAKWLEENKSFIWSGKIDFSV
jgi:hypothetical protein